ncbi:MAG: ElyC/SanA/YdcF family protein [Bacteroidota bacterium]
MSLILFILVTNVWVVQSTKSRIHVTNQIPKNEVALVLGTSKRTGDGGRNRFFVERMNAAAVLYHLKSVKHILVSGDNRTKHYNEPRDMLNALGELYIPEEDISMDYAGFRTLDSVVRSKEVFGQESITIVTQQFHCYRSLFIANHFGMDAVAYAADLGISSIGFNLAFREVLARSFAVIDLYVLRRKPKFLGEKIQLEIKE